MAYGFSRFLTTHTGSLPRPDDLTRPMFAKEEGVPVDRAALAARIRGAVAEVVKKQVEAGINLVNDGEMSKPSYATYVKDRLTGFAGSSDTFVYQDRPSSRTWRGGCSAIPAARAGERLHAPPQSGSAIRPRRSPTSTT
jgi:methionine synthase II (cobalamin-independent)